MAFFYAAIFFMIGIHVPFWPVWLAAKGLNAPEIGAVIASGVGIKIIFNPLIAHIADHSGRRKPIMVGLAVLAFATFALFGLTDGFWPILLVSVLFFTVWSPLMPLGESLAMLSSGDSVEEDHTGHGGELDYGRVRLWGSLTFIAGAVGTGYILTGQNAELIYQILLGSLVLVVAVSLFLPPTRAPSRDDTGFAALAVLKDRRFILFICATALIQASHSVYYGFGTLNWKAQGFSETVIGLLWAEGVIAEIILFLYGARLVARLGPSKMILLGGLAGSIRWAATGVTENLAALVILQALHALTFAATHLGAIYFISRRIPQALSASAQSLYSAVVMGLALGVAMFASGKLFDLYGPGAYHAMAVMSATGALLAIVLAATRR
ncbi:MAG: MFS transporter [Rhodospirillales bacterium]|nr:MFS transporter [Alphaproteobacteria bacterium]MBL6947480.1 MFS transporter [Rhodospirillales bacterium]